MVDELRDFRVFDPIKLQQTNTIKYISPIVRKGLINQSKKSRRLPIRLARKTITTFSCLGKIGFAREANKAVNVYTQTRATAMIMANASRLEAIIKSPAQAIFDSGLEEPKIILYWYLSLIFSCFSNPAL
jgi:hypothetical protein